MPGWNETTNKTKHSNKATGYQTKRMEVYKGTGNNDLALYILSYKSTLTQQHLHHNNIL